jgi:hypothetical protein
MGGGNHVDNMGGIRGFSYFFECHLSKEEFVCLAFLANESVRDIVPRGQDRRLAAVAERAAALGSVKIGSNWDLVKVRERTARMLLQDLPPTHLLLRDVRGGERDYGAEWYLQEGCHRALGFAIAVREGTTRYSPWPAYLATNRDRLIREQVRKNFNLG